MALQTCTDTCAEEHFDLGDCRLFYRHWQPHRPSDRIVFLFHRGHEHSGRLAQVVEELGIDNAHIIAWDARGHGRSPGRRGFAPDGFASLVDDMDRFVRGMASELDCPLHRCVVVAHSVASVVATTWVHDHAPDLAGLVLVTPAFRVRLYVPFALPALRLAKQLKPDLKITSYVKGRLLTHDSDAAQRYDNDPLICKDISNRILVEMAEAAERVVADAHTMRTPLLMVQAGSDWVVDNAVQDQFFKRYAALKQRVDLPGFYHAVLSERDSWRATRPIADFIAARWQSPLTTDRRLIEGGDPVNACRSRRLRQAPTPLSPRWCRAMLGRLLLGSLGRLSHGIRLGWRHGFDSGQSLDHVYGNRAIGSLGIGRLIDRCYLDAIGWRGIRQRKIHIEAALLAAMKALDPNARPTQILDIASGPGRYLLDFIRQHPDRQITARLRDRDADGIAAGRKQAEAAGLTTVDYRIGDAFAPSSILENDGWPTIGIVSGLYELFDDNALVLTSLRALANCLQRGGYVIYTNQPWHPQLDFIADVLPNRDGQRWIMRCRPQVEMDGLVREAGLEKLRTWADRWGIFTVSLAWKRPQ